MDLLIPAFVICALVMLGMAVGVIFGNIRIKGTCGGLGAMRDDLGQPMCECGAREGEVCGGRAEEEDRPRAAGILPVYRSRSGVAPPTASASQGAA